MKNHKNLDFSREKVIMNETSGERVISNEFLEKESKIDQNSRDRK